MLICVESHKNIPLWPFKYTPKLNIEGAQLSQCSKVWHFYLTKCSFNINMSKFVFHLLKTLEISCWQRVRQHQVSLRFDVWLTKNERWNWQEFGKRNLVGKREAWRGSNLLVSESLALPMVSYDPVSLSKSDCPPGRSLGAGFVSLSLSLTLVIWSGQR